ncbi:MAG: 4Fe-4S dicluster domain-containing protein [Rikenellaceae bacterium]|nr:4Fe-4S dicluster domain-containing protein [Rikenellaceae bacterium]
MKYYDHFVLPFLIGAIVLFAVVLYKYVRWFWLLPPEDKRTFRRGIFTRKTFGAVGEVFSESLLHRRIFRANPLLGYMHMSLAFGWFLLIVVGWMETSYFMRWGFAPIHTHIFFKYFFSGVQNEPYYAAGYAFAMDFLLLFVLSGVALAWFKRVRSRAMGMRRTTRHTAGDRVALSALWFIFPARLVAESTTSGIYGNGSFLTGSVGRALSAGLGPGGLAAFEPYAWWFYSIVLAVFFIAMPFSRYMHIFTEIPLIFMRRYGLHSGDKQKSYDHFQIEACSRCGICIDPCQLQRDAGVDSVQSVYFLRDRRYGRLTEAVADNCLMCGRCEQACPVGIELNALRLNARDDMRNGAAEGRYDYVKGADRSAGEGRVGYFAGCMTLLTPRILDAMRRIFEASGEAVWWADKDGGVCCGRPLKLSGEVDAAAKMMDYNKGLFARHGITTLVTSCPICLKVFREDYGLQEMGIRVLHHSEYMLGLIREGRLRLKPGATVYTYHDPCELGRGCGIYDEPRELISGVGRLVEVAENRERAFCCGGSVANTALDDDGQRAISRGLGTALRATGAEAVVTACPLCKKSIVRGTPQPVYDLAEVVAGSLA